MALSQTLTQQGGVSTGSDTYTAMPIGTAASDRVVTVLFSVSVSPSSVTIGGVTATTATDSSTGVDIILASALVPSGTTGDVVANGTGGFTVFGCWSTTGNANTAATAFSVQTGSASPTVSVLAGGVILGVAADFSGVGPTVSFNSGITTQANGFTAGGAPGADGGGNFATAQSPTCGISGATTPFSILVALAPLPVIVEQSFFETTKLTRPSEFSSALPFKPFISPPGQSFFEPAKLKRQIIDDRGVVFQPATVQTNVVEQSFFEPTKLKRPSEFSQGPFAGVSPAQSTKFAPAQFYDGVKLKQPVIDDKPLSIKPYISPVVEQAFFEPIKLKQPVIDNPPILFQPAAIAVTNIVEQPFFDAVKLKRPTEFGQGPFAGTSPAIGSVYITQGFFDQVKLKQPIIDKPSDMAPLVLVVNLSASNWFDAVKLMKVPERFGELYPQQYWTPQNFDPWFDQVKLLKVPERLQEAFGRPFPPGQSLTAWFDQVQKLKVPGDFQFTATGATQPVTIQNALTDWFPTVKLKQPIIDPGLVVYFPAQQIVVVAEHHDRPFFATPGQLMTQ